jgi:crossover junction endodeoxyribonuclease RuvC
MREMSVAAHPGHRPGPAGDRLWRHRTAWQAAGLCGQRLHQVGDKESLPERIKTLFAGISEVIATYAAESGGGGKSLRQRQSAIHPAARPGPRRGDQRAGACDLPVAEYTALQVKQAVVGHGKAAKEQVQHMVIRPAQPAGAPSADAADALACAICHAHGGQGLGALATAGYRVRGGRLIG